MKIFNTKKYGSTTAAMTDEGSFIILPGGDVVESKPEDTDDYRATAGLLHMTPLQMAQTHDIMHARLADMLGLYESPALRGAVDGTPIDDVTGAEEDAVLAIQRFLALHNKKRYEPWPA